MFWKTRLACSFCGKSATEVAKLVAGPKVYICDACAAIAIQIMRNSDGAMSQAPLPTATLWQRFLARLSLSHDRSRSRNSGPLLSEREVRICARATRRSTRRPPAGLCPLVGAG